MFSQMPRKLTHFNLLIEGLAYFGKVEEMTLPKIVLDTEDYRGGGMDTPLVIDKGLQKLEAEFTLAEYEAPVMKRFGMRLGGPISLIARGALTKDATAFSMSATMRGVITQLDLGTWKAGDNTALKFSMVCSYYRLDWNEMEVIEIDVPNMVRRVDGVDQLAMARAAIWKV